MKNEVAEKLLKYDIGKQFLQIIIAPILFLPRAIGPSIVSRKIKNISHSGRHALVYSGKFSFPKNLAE